MIIIIIIKIICAHVYLSKISIFLSVYLSNDSFPPPHSIPLILSFSINNKNNDNNNNNNNNNMCTCVPV